MKEVKIEAPIGFEIDKEKSTFDLIKFKPIATEKSLKEQAKEWLTEMWEQARWNMKRSYDNCPTFFIDNQWMFQLDRKNGKLYVYYQSILHVLETKYKLNGAEIKDLCLSVVGKDLNCEGLTPRECKFF